MKYLITISAVLILTITALYSPLSNLIVTQKPVNKEISLAIYTANNYTSQAYENSLASVHVTVTKINGKHQTTVWEKTFAGLRLKDYPNLDKALTQTITVQNVMDNKEKLVVTYTITYDTKGSLLQIDNGKVIAAGNKGNLFINI